MEEYLTTKELSERIKMAQGTIRNLVWKKVFVEDLHCIKPTGRKLLFIWSAIKEWLHNPTSQTLSQGKSFINI